MKKNDEYYMNCAYKEALKAYKIDEIPVGAIIVDKNGKIIGKGYNKKEKKNNAIYHAEVEAIIKAEKCRVDRIEEVYLDTKEEEIHEMLMNDEFNNSGVQV